MLWWYDVPEYVIWFWCVICSRSSHKIKNLVQNSGLEFVFWCIFHTWYSILCSIWWSDITWIKSTSYLGSIHETTCKIFQKKSWRLACWRSMANNWRITIYPHPNLFDKKSMKHPDVLELAVVLKASNEVFKNLEQIAIMKQDLENENKKSWLSKHLTFSQSEKLRKTRNDSCYSGRHRYPSLIVEHWCACFCIQSEMNSS